MAPPFGIFTPGWGPPIRIAFANLRSIEMLGLKNRDRKPQTAAAAMQRASIIIHTVNNTVIHVPSSCAPRGPLVFWGVR